MFFKKKQPKEYLSMKHAAVITGVMLGVGGAMVVFGIAMAGDEAATLLGFQEHLEPSWVTVGLGGGGLIGLGIFMVTAAWKILYKDLDAVVEKHNSKVLAKKETMEIMHFTGK